MNARSFVLVVLAACCAAGCAIEKQHQVNVSNNKDATSATMRVTAEKEAFFGDLHLHTAYSTDAVLLSGTTVTPDQAYRYARGETVTVLGKSVRLDRPFDFMAVTDHAELMGAGLDLFDPTTAAGQSAFGRGVQKAGAPDSQFLRKLFTSKSPAPGVDWDSIMRSTWRRQIDVAQKYNEPGRFTTFVGFEWSSTPGFNNLHRNVIFASDKVALPYGANDSERPEDLWAYMERNRQNGIESLAIPHNGNLSNGLMYAAVDSDGMKIDKAYAQRRARNEPLNEITQTKGQSDTDPEMSPQDEFANFEVFDEAFGGKKQKTKSDGSYLRQALARGLAISEEVGANPYKTGFIGASDLHSGLSNSDEAQFRGMHGPADDLSKRELEKFVGIGQDLSIVSIMKTGSAGLAGVWAESNSRQSIFAALQRRETFATSGSRIKVRFFAGWNYDQAILEGLNWTAAYAGGVPMGGDLPPAQVSGASPDFIVWAQKDPQGANLDRIQIIKVWAKNGAVQERIFDVALSDGRTIDPKTFKGAALRNTVNLKTGTYENSVGAAELATLWKDPTFKSGEAAAYYVRALEIPTPRWTTMIASEIGADLPKAVPATIQERAWSSPIWYDSSKASRK